MWPESKYCRENQSHKENFPLLNNNMRTAEETKLSLALFIALKKYLDIKSFFLVVYLLRLLWQLKEIAL